jgi:transcriptional regulator with XRE-family HTH domain
MPPIPMPPKQEPEEAAFAAFGDRLRKALKKVGKNQKQLARKVGVDEGNLSKVLRGERGFEAKNLLALLQAAWNFDVSLDYIIADFGDPQRSLELRERARVGDLLRVIANGQAPTSPESDSRRSGDRPAARHRRR